MGVVNTVPTGLLDLLAAKTGGKLPTQMSEVLQPMLSLDQFYVNKKMGVIPDGGLSTTAIAVATSVPVPPGELWQLLGISSNFVSVTGAEVVRLQYSINNLPESATPGTGHVIYSPDQVTPVSVGELMSRSFTLPLPFLLPPGANINAVCARRSATVTVNSTYLVYRFKV